MCPSAWSRQSLFLAAHTKTIQIGDGVQGSRPVQPLLITPCTLSTLSTLNPSSSQILGIVREGGASVIQMLTSPVTQDGGPDSCLAYKTMLHLPPVSVGSHAHLFPYSDADLVIWPVDLSTLLLQK